MNETVKQVIVVEGKSDTAAVRRALPGVSTIETHGYGITDETMDEIRKAYERRGIIIFTDPDHAGETIRKRLKAAFPQASEAFLIREEASKSGDVGIENGTPEDILEALGKAKIATEKRRDIFTENDLKEAGLVGEPGSAALRQKVGKILGIGYGNAGAFLKKLNTYDITREELNEALRTGNGKRD